jgi:pantoate--beta-alanine ligase
LQFGKNEDFSSYPKTVSQDIQLLETLGCNYLFIPETNFAENLDIIEPKFSDVLCGLSRPSHFHGVLTIINKFLRIIKPNALFIWSQRLSATTDHKGIC